MNPNGHGPELAFGEMIRLGAFLAERGDTGLLVSVLTRAVLEAGLAAQSDTEVS